MRAGFIGTGYFASEHAGNLKRLGVDVAACSGVDAEQTEAFAKEFGAKVWDSPLEMIERNNIDILYVVIPPFAHNGEVELAAVEKGIPFLCEKPVGLDVDKCREIAMRIEKKRLVTASGYWLKAGETSAKIKQVISENEISFVQGFWHSGFIMAPWWSRMETSGGPLVEMVTHYVDYMRYMLGEIESVAAITNRGINTTRPNCDVYDSIASLLRFKNGQIGTLSSTHILPPDIEDSKRVMEITGRDFYMCVETDTVKYKCGSDKLVELEFETDRIKLNDKRFIEAVEKNNPDMVYGNYADALKTLETTIAITKSAEQSKGDWLDIKYQQ